MPISRVAKALLVVAVLLGVAVYAVIVDLGVNAGKVHEGVEVAGVDLGGMTEIEAIEALEGRADEIREQRIVFGGGGFRRSTSARELGWEPDVARTAGEAFEVGRTGAPFGALGARFSAWTEGVKVRWAGSFAPALVRRLLDRWEDQAANNGLELDRPRLRFKLKQAVNTWPMRSFHRLPILDE